MENTFVDDGDIQPVTNRFNKNTHSQVPDISPAYFFFQKIVPTPPLLLAPILYG